MKTEREHLEDAKEIIRKHQAEITLLNRRIREMQRENDTAETIREEIYKLSARDPEPPEWTTRVPSSSNRQETPIFVWSDWHYGEVVDPAQIGHVNSFNARIAKERICKLVDTSIYLAMEKNGLKKPTYPGAIICLGGDFITGDIHDELRITNDKTPQEAIEDLTDLLAAGIEQMATAFGRLYVPAVVGNHGRSTLKPRNKGRVITSHEWNIYCNVRRHFRGTDKIRFDISPGIDVAFRSYGLRYLLTHGDSLGVKGGDGIIGALGPILRGSMKVHASEAAKGQDFDTLIIGHWHQALFFKRVMVNNALIGMSEFSNHQLRAPYSPAGQIMWFTHPERGITSMREIELDKRRIGVAERAWVSWQE